ncbi:SDR family oxidoreductase, partial [Endozoicomonas sp. ONNA1]|uniref:SDR family oxidoreductase n=1 Tax=Endozoicomonas sp. ONNA1 TaxID=2828740 RepID=UPI0021481C84
PDQSLYRKEGLLDLQQPKKPITYSVIKSGLIGMTRYLATYWAEDQVRCNAICPGGVYTDQSEQFLERIERLIPLGRMAQLHEYDSLVVYLLSEHSSYMTGSIISIDGGRTAL